MSLKNENAHETKQEQKSEKKPPSPTRTLPKYEITPLVVSFFSLLTHTSSLLKHIMPIQPPHLPPRDRTLAHPPPHRAHLPTPAPAISQRALNRFPDIPTPATQFLDAPSEPFVGVFALAQAGDCFVAQLDDFEGEGGRREEVGGLGGVEEGGLGYGGDGGEVEVVDR